VGQDIVEMAFLNERLPFTQPFEQDRLLQPIWVLGQDTLDFQT
jgi:hypothetical protein